MEEEKDSKNYVARVKKEIEQISYMIKAHQLFAQKPEKTRRKSNENNLYFIHPLWCGLTLLFEPKLDQALKEEGYLALLYHDLLEDTKKELPKNLSKKVVEYVRDLTFYGGTKEEIKNIWSKSKEVRLLKLYDKVSNYMDDRWLSEEKRKIYQDYIIRLCNDVEKNYGVLRITQIAKAIINS